MALVDRRRQQGQALVEWMLVALLATLAVAWAAGEFVQKAEQAAVQGYAHWLKAAASALTEVMRHEDAGSAEKSPLLAQVPMNQLIPIEPVLEGFKHRGWLVQALVSQPKMPYDVRLLRLDSTGTCADRDKCPVTLLLLAIPSAHQQGAHQRVTHQRVTHQTPHPAAMLQSLDGQGLAVTDLAPHRLQGASFQLDNPLINGLRLPVGTIGILAWRLDRPPPYVRLNETRRVSLSGGLQLGRLADTKASCYPEDVVMIGLAGSLQICREGRWQAVSERHDHVRACLPQKRGDPMQEALLRLSGFWAVFGQERKCQCPAGFAPFSPGSGSAHVGAVKLESGQACLRL